MASRLLEVFSTFESLTDPRIERTRQHNLLEIVVLALCGTIADANSWADIERFGNERLDWLRTFLKLENGIPSHDTFGRVFARLDAAQLMACLRQWIVDLNRDIGQHIAIDGKTLRGSHDRAAGRNPLHLISAWSSEARLTLGQIAVDCKSNEITAIPLLLDLLDLKGATVTIDAMGCQKEIANKIIAGGGNYVLALKGNHEKLHAAVEAEFEKVIDAEYKVKELRRWTTEEKNRGRLERRQYMILPAPQSLPGRALWQGLACIAMVLRITTVDGVEKGEVSYFLTSLPNKVKEFAKLVRQHWSIESTLHWVLDVTFTEDASRIRRQQGPHTSAWLRRLAVSILSQDTAIKDNVRGKRYRAALSTDALETIILGFTEG
jgi:predicted transposase YbfD/YdcC